MTNQDHLEQLEQGVAHWNQWRKQQREILPDLSDADLSNTDLSGADLIRVDLSGADLSSSDLSGAYLWRANLKNAHLRSANLVRVDLRSANLAGVDLSSADLSYANLRDVDLGGADLSRTYLWRANLSGADLSLAYLIRVDLRSADLNDADLNGADLNGADLSGADLSDADLSHANLSTADLIRANLIRADLGYANLTHADLSYASVCRANLAHADLTHADLTHTDLSRANLSDAQLSETNLSYANLSRADLSHADLTRAIVGDTVFAQVDFRDVKGLAELQHDGPSSLALHTLQLPQDGSAFFFLRGTGIPDEWIDICKSTLVLPIQYHSCFLSYSSEDGLLARRLHADLQAQGVRCWFAPHDMQPGQYMRKEIDQAIHVQEKTLLLLSRHSISSGWMEYEVEIALARERKQQREILFPVSLDEAFLQSTTGWAHSLKSTRHIGDFTQWANPRGYQQAFDRLLKDLKKAIKES